MRLYCTLPQRLVWRLLGDVFISQVRGRLLERPDSRPWALYVVRRGILRGECIVFSHHTNVTYATHHVRLLFVTMLNTDT